MMVVVVGWGGAGKSLHSSHPTNNALLIDFLVSSDAEIFVNKH